MLLKTSQAAQRLGVRPETLREWRQRKIGPPYTTTAGGHARYENDELDAYLASRKVTA